MTLSLSPLRLGFLLVALLVPALSVAAPTPAEAQSSLRARRARARRARVRRQRLRARRQRRAARVRARRERILARSRGARPAPADEGAADMEFALPEEPQEAPPPMAENFVEEVEQRQHQARVDDLDPELYGAGRSDGGPASRGRFSPLTAQLTFGGVHRSLSYSGYERGALTPYTLPLGATVGMGVDYYPGAHATDDALAHLGLHWRFEHSLGVGSTGPNEVSYPTTFFAFDVGARYRVPLDDTGSQVVVIADVGQHRFHVMRGSLENPAPEGIPEAAYTQLRLGVSGRWALGDFGIGGRLAYTPVLDAGALATTFGGADAHGFEGALRADYALPLGFAVLLEVDTRVYALGFSPEPSRPVIATGGLDAYVGARLGVEWRMPAMRDL